MFVKLNDPKGIDLKLGDETAECTVATKNTCGKMKCGKMLSSSTGFACCSDSFDYSGTPHCSHDAKLWNTMFTEDNKVNPKVAKMVAKMAVSEGERQIKALQNSAAIEPEFKCMIEHGTYAYLDSICFVLRGPVSANSPAPRLAPCFPAWSIFRKHPPYFSNRP